MPRPLLWMIALALSAISLFCATVWMVVIRSPHGIAPVELGYGADYVPASKAQKITRVVKDSPAQRVGLKIGDLIVAIDGEPLADNDYQNRIWLRSRPGDKVRLTIERPGESSLRTVTATFRSNPAATNGSFSEQLGLQLRGSFPVPFLLVGLAVLFLRIDDPIVWLLALLFAGFAAAPDLPDVPLPLPAGLPRLVLAYKTVAFGLLGPMFYWFFAFFPTRSPMERRAPWLKWVAIGMTLLFVLPPYRHGVPRLPPLILNPESRFSAQLTAAFIFDWIVLGMVSLAFNYFQATDGEVRRKLRIIFWGTVVGVAPIAIEQTLATLTGHDAPRWLDTVLVVVAFLFPLSFGYAVVKERVLEIPVLLKRSARYLLVQRGFTFLLSVLSIGLTLVFAAWLQSYFGPTAQVSQASGVAIGAVFGTALLWGGTQIHRKVSGRIDRAFFRNAYDARRILEDLAEEIRSVTDPVELAELLERKICDALRPRDIAIRILAGDSTPLSGLQEAEYVAPMLGRNNIALGAIALGQRLSEEPYSNEDKKLVASVASQAATALDNFRLAEEIATRREAERKTALEMEVAKEVQARLLPQHPPRLRTLSCAAQCIQARSIGGDYFDFLPLGETHLGLVLADVSGKGVHAALLVANLQAYLRSQSSAGVLDPAQALCVVNRMLWSTTASQHYATLFYGIYEESTRKLRYVNCGHNPPILLRSQGAVERLEATALVIGLFEKWTCAIAETTFEPGDLFAVYSDGVTEAAKGDEEFGEERLIALLESNRDKPVDEIVKSSLAHVQEFCSGIMADDMTMLVARGET